MIILEGSPGAGKTTALAAALTTSPSRVLAFPEAQPERLTDSAEPPAAHAGPASRTVTDLLIREDEARVEAARRARDVAPDTVVISDRCYLNVLAYRYALATLNRVPWRAFDHALTVVARRELPRRRAQDTVIVVLLDPVESLRRRAGHAATSQHSLWFDPEFLAAHREFWERLDRWPILSAHGGGPQLRFQAAFPTSDLVGEPASPLHAAGPPTLGPAMAAAQNLVCLHGCTGARSPVVVTTHGVTQLYPSTIHVAPGGNRSLAEVRCLHRAADITDDWIRSYTATQRPMP